MAAVLRRSDSRIDIRLDVDNIRSGGRVGEYHSVRDIAIAVVNETAKAAALIALYAVSITYVLDIAGGILMVTAQYLTEKFLEPLRERLREEGREEGIAEGAPRLWIWCVSGKTGTTAAWSPKTRHTIRRTAARVVERRDDNGHRSISD